MARYYDIDPDAAKRVLHKAMVGVACCPTGDGAVAARGVLPFVECLARDMLQAVSIVCAMRPDVVELFRSQGRSRPETTASHYIHAQKEHELLQHVTSAESSQGSSRRINARGSSTPRRISRACTTPG